MAKAAPKPKAKAKAAPRPLSGWCALQAAIKQGDYSHLCLRVLCKSGEKCLQMSWGPLRFVDSMNVFPTSLASMIDDLRACTHKQLPELFPLMASLHPELQLRTPTDSPPQRRPLKQRRTHCDLEQAWDCILRKLPMPFKHFCGAEAWEMPAVWEQHCYDSVLAGKAVSAEDHRLAVNTANLMGWETFREFHDCYLHTDVLALADVMESYRDSFRLDPIHYVTLPGAAWDAMLRHSAPIHLITNEQAYVDVRASVMGGLSCIFQPFAQAKNPELGEEDYNSEEPVSWISYLDFNAMYPAAMSLPMPNGPCKTVALPEENAARLSWLHDTCLSGLNWESDSRGGELSAPRGLRLSCGGARPLGLGSACAHEGREGPVRAAHSEHGGAPRPLPVALREARALPWHARRGGRGRQAAQVPAGRAGCQDLEAAQSLPLCLQPLHGGFHGAQAQRAEAAQDGGERGRREGGEAHPERHLRPLLHEPRQVQEHERLRSSGLWARAP